MEELQLTPIPIAVRPQVQLKMIQGAERGAHEIEDDEPIFGLEVLKACSEVNIFETRVNTE